MGLIKDFLGIILIFVSFFNPFDLNFPFRILLFILGFDLMSFLPKIALFLFDYFFGFSGLGILLVLLLFADILVKAIFEGLALIAKPLLVFILLYFVFPDLALSFAAGAINFLINFVSLFKI